MSIDRGMDRGFGERGERRDDGWYDTYQPRRDAKRYQQTNGNGHGSASNGKQYTPAWQLRTTPCDVCGRRPGLRLYWRFAEERRVTAPPVAGVLTCNGDFCRAAVVSLALPAGGAREVA